MTPSQQYKKTLIAIHVAVWVVIILSPLMFFDRGERFDIGKLIPTCSSTAFMMVVFYTMYLYVTPRFLLKGEKRKFWFYTTLIVVGAGLLLHLWLLSSHRIVAVPQNRVKPFHTPPVYAEVFFILRNVFNMAVTATIATMSVLSIKWQASETARKDAEMARADAELKNLRNQINPHFLLNTLNNIYALTAFNQDKAQKAILELSGMLRHILYDNQQKYVELANEVKFIHSYINLMKIRLSSSTDIKVEVSLPENEKIYVAPLIFISLIENAFKHGIAATGKSFIHVKIEATAQQILCSIENSNHPKQESDRSGHGIGLEQVTKRLELSYPDKYSWEKGLKENNTVYYSKIIIYDTKLRNN